METHICMASDRNANRSINRWGGESFPNKQQGRFPVTELSLFVKFV